MDFDYGGTYERICANNSGRNSKYDDKIVNLSFLYGAAKQSWRAQNLFFSSQTLQNDANEKIVSSDDKKANPSAPTDLGLYSIFRLAGV